MPIFMDRHDVSESVTAENVAHLHKEDLKIQNEFNCRGLTYWFDDIKKIAFCLIEAPNEESIHKMHNHAHGEVPNQIIEVDANLVESFLGRIKDPDHSSPNELTRINDPAQRTLMVIRVTTLSLKNVSISQLETNIQQVIHSMSELFNRFEGRLVKQDGSYLLVSFKSGYTAVLSATEAKKIFNDLNKGFRQSSLGIKIGLATGMPVSKDKTIFEDTIKMADGFCLLNKNEIVVSTEVKETFNIENQNATFPIADLHTVTLSDENFLIRLIDFTEKQWQNADLKVDDFGRSMGMSKTLMYRKMMLLTKKSPNNFLKEYRLNRALEVINLKVKTISEIAFQSGFNSTSYFSKCFQKRFGVLPSVYLKS